VTTVGVKLIIGADRGIGRCIAIELQGRGDQVVAACLGDGSELEAEGLRVEPFVDVTSDEAVDAMAANLRSAGIEIDWVFHVAGVLALDDLETVDFDEVRREFEINAIGPLRVAKALAPLLADGAKIGIVTSRVGSLADNSSGGMYAYRMSKAAANMAGLNLHHELKGRGIDVLMLHPGMVATDLTKDLGGAYADAEYISPDEAGHGLIANMDGLSPQRAGRFQHSNGEYLPW
jgi:NAD(P)-dependent dehydrogenase (short-subunit alcohol dehydrogenase family)